jgi:hypothetical protein
MKVQMTRYVLVDDTTKEILQEVEGDKEFRTGSPPDLPLKPFSWLPLEDEGVPSYDFENEVSEGPNLVVTDKKVTKSWTTRAKTEEELDARKDQLVDDLFNFPALAAFIKAIDDGAIQPGAGVGVDALRAKIKAAL